MRILRDHSFQDEINISQQNSKREGGKGTPIIYALPHQQMLEMDF
jgi:hypothetical protein